MDLIDKMYPHNLIPSVTTDGFIWAGNQPLDKEKIVKVIKKTAPKQWVTVNDKYFGGGFLNSNQNCQMIQRNILKILLWLI